MMLPSKALIVVMAQIKGWMLSSEMDQFFAATFMLPKLVAKLAI
jgi:hypothetical protein